MIHKARIDVNPSAVRQTTVQVYLYGIKYPSPVFKSNGNIQTYIHQNRLKCIAELTKNDITGRFNSPVSK